MSSAVSPTYHGTMTGNGDVVEAGAARPAPWVFDLLLGIAVTLTVSLFIAADIGDARPDVWAYLWAIGLGALMLARRRYPVVVVVLSVAAVISYYAAGYPPIGVAVPLAAAVFSAAEFGRVAAAITASATVVAISVVYRLAVDQDPAFVVGYDLPAHALMLGGAIAFGDSVRSRRELRRSAAEIAALTADRVERQAEQRVSAERLAIARELHDSVGHALTVISLHTQVLEERIDRDDAEARASLEAIADTTSRTFADLRRTVAALRKGEAPPRSPLRMEDLQAAMLPAVHAGIAVHAHVDIRSALTPTVEAAVYRIVQEAVTNVVRHAGASRVDVRVEGGAGDVTVTVTDDGRGARDDLGDDSPAIGNGLDGMRERAQLLGGTFTAGPGENGFTVRARIPLEENPTEEEP